MDYSAIKCSVGFPQLFFFTKRLSSVLRSRSYIKIKHSLKMNCVVHATVVDWPEATWSLNRCASDYNRL